MIIKERQSREMDDWTQTRWMRAGECDVCVSIYVKKHWSHLARTQTHTLTNTQSHTQPLSAGGGGGGVKGPPPSLTPGCLEHKSCYLGPNKKSINE